jgi:carbon storage regulator CsrA
MLVLSGRKDESIMIGDDVEITIVDIRGQKVRLGIIIRATDYVSVGLTYPDFWLKNACRYLAIGS